MVATKQDQLDNDLVFLGSANRVEETENNMNIQKWTVHGLLSRIYALGSILCHLDELSLQDRDRHSED